MPIREIMTLIAFMIVGTTFSVATFFVQHRTPEVADTQEYAEGIEYSEEMGPTCPLDVRLLGKKGAPSIDCTCPTGYTMDTAVIGYERCYGNAECPILISECIADTQY